jgi:flagellar biosynthesis/type III secretory pathway M-ring protein FliF/YscJ
MKPQLEGGLEAQQLAGAQDGGIKKQLEEHAEQKRQQVAEAQQKLKLQPVQTPKAEVLAGYLRESIANDPQTAAGAIRSWLNEE